MEAERDTINYNTQQAVFNGENAKTMGKKILKPIVQEKIVKVPVTQYVEKIIEKEEIKYVNKYVDVIKPIITYKTKHISKPIYLDKIKYEKKILEREKIIHIPKIEYRNKIVDVPVYVHKEKIIPKNVPLIIERVIPVLKVKTHEKNVLAETIAVPEICDMSVKNEGNKGLKVVTENQQQENSNRLSVNKMNYAPNLRSNEVDVTQMKTYRFNDGIVEQNENVCTNVTMEGKPIKKGPASSSASANEDNESNVDNRPPQKHNTEYHDETNEDPYSVRQSEETPEEIHASINIEQDLVGNGEHIINESHQYHSMEDNLHYNTTRVSVHLPDHANGREVEGYEQVHSGDHSNYNASISNLISMNNINNMNNLHNMNNNIMVNENGQMYIMDTGNGNKSISEQVIKHSAAQIDPKLYSYPVHTNYQENYQDLVHEQVDVEQIYGKINAPSVSREQHNVMYNMTSERVNPNMKKQMLRPSYANSNGHAIVSVRPATIVEYKPKSRKNRPPMCNFLNNCCRGNKE